jgi:mannose-6-phosphate isomerase
VNPQQRLSLQSHEHWVVVEGRGEVTIRENFVPCEVYSQFLIPRGAKHRIHNTSVDAPFIFVEVQVGDVLEEGDIVRYEDDYLRSK